MAQNDCLKLLMLPDLHSAQEFPSLLVCHQPLNIQQGANVGLGSGLMCSQQIYPTNPNRTDLLLLIGAIYYQLGNYQECIAFNDRCILLDAQMAEAHANLANALQQLGNFDMAIIYYQVWTNAVHVCSRAFE